MRALLVATCLWPGLPRLWLRGDWSSLTAAVAFGAALNLVLVSSFVWPELFPSSWVLAGWFLVAAAGCLSAYRSWRALPELRGAARVDERALFIRAQGEYLQGHWYEAEALLQELVGRSPPDVEARLMLATLYRHTRRCQDARECLERLEDLEGADRWQWEIARERQLIDSAAQSVSPERQSQRSAEAEAETSGTMKAAS